jgi:hypothetical protein
MEELWRGSNECLMFGLARASNNVTSTLSVSAKREDVEWVPCVVEESKDAKRRGFIAE